MIVPISKSLIGCRVFIRETKSSVSNGMVGVVSFDGPDGLYVYVPSFGEDYSVSLVEEVGDADLLALCRDQILSRMSSDHWFAVASEVTGAKVRADLIDGCYNRDIGSDWTLERFDVSVLEMLSMLMLDANRSGSAFPADRKAPNGLMSDFDLSDVSQIARVAHIMATEKGFWEGDKMNMGEKLMLVVSELSEALEADRASRRASVKAFVDDVMSDVGYEQAFKSHVKDSFEDELADAVIRIFDLSEHLGIDIRWHICAKMKFNSLRPHKHGKNY